MLVNKQLGGVIVDAGNVIIDHETAQTTRQKVDIPGWYETIPAIPGSFETLKRLNDAFGGNVTVAFNAADIIDEKILGWFRTKQFCETTGIPLENLRRTIPGAAERDKSVFMHQSSATHYGTTIVIDDRMQVMNYFAGKGMRLFLFRPQESDLRDHGNGPAKNEVTIVQSWKEIEEILFP